MLTDSVTARSACAGADTVSVAVLEIFPFLAVTVCVPGVLAVQVAPVQLPFGLMVNP